MTNPSEVQQALLAASRELQALIDRHDGLVEDAVNTQRASKLAQASAMLAQDPKATVQVKEAHVDQATADIQATAERADKLLTSNKLAIQAAMARLSAMQSLNSALREEMRLARVGDVGA